LEDGSHEEFIGEIGGLGMSIITDKSHSDNGNRDENDYSTSSADGEVVLECSDFEMDIDIDIDFESGLAVGQYLIDDASNLNADPEDDIPETQWYCYSVQDVAVPTVDATTEHGSPSRGLQFEDEVPLPSFPV
jgi:hypothetical protein